jgi:hypothetical protein
MRGLLEKAATQVLGEPPPRGAPKIVRLRYVRRFYTRLLPLYALAR